MSDSTSPVNPASNPTTGRRPTSTDLYRFFDVHDVLLYIGISLNAAQRASQHRAYKHWWDEVHRMEVEHLSCDRTAALEVERLAILVELPLYNVTHNTISNQPPPTPHQSLAFDAFEALHLRVGGLAGDGIALESVTLLYAAAKAIDDLAHYLDVLDYNEGDDHAQRDFHGTIRAIARSLPYGQTCDNDECRAGHFEPLYPIRIDVSHDNASCLYVCHNCFQTSASQWLVKS